MFLKYYLAPSSSFFSFVGLIGLAVLQFALLLLLKQKKTHYVTHKLLKYEIFCHIQQEESMTFLRLLNQIEWSSKKSFQISEAVILLRIFLQTMQNIWMEQFQ